VTRKVNKTGDPSATRMVMSCCTEMVVTGEGDRRCFDRLHCLLSCVIYGIAQN
jgi:hypothetical protein